MKKKSIANIIYSVIVLASGVSHSHVTALNYEVSPLTTIVVEDSTPLGYIYKQFDIGDTSYNPSDFITDGYTIPTDYVPFNIRVLNQLQFVTFAQQLPPDNTDDEAGLGNGYVAAFTLSGFFLAELISQGNLNSPWGLEWAPSNFGEFSGALLIGNYGDGKINAYDMMTGTFLGTLTDANNDPIVIDGLWSLYFDSNGILNFTSMPTGASDGLTGTIIPLP